ncbi:MAG: hypothetical protein LC714_02075 [Actinobacteria bacterium]|nr:hypothetical protein [Actinomycetota bacterium]
MATELKVPTLGMDMEEAAVVRWLVEEGAEVRKGDPVLEIDTDKTSFEIEAPADGTIRNLRGEPGDTLPVGTTLAYVTAPGEEIPEPEEETPDAARTAGSTSPTSLRWNANPKPPPLDTRLPKPSAASRSRASGASGPSGRLAASPRSRTSTSPATSMRTASWSCRSG